MSWQDDYRRKRDERQAEQRALRETELVKLEQFAQGFPDVDKEREDAREEMCSCDAERRIEKLPRPKPTDDDLKRVQKALDRIVTGVLGELDGTESPWGEVTLRCSRIHSLYGIVKYPAFDDGSDVPTLMEVLSGIQSMQAGLQFQFNWAMRALERRLARVDGKERKDG